MSDTVQAAISDGSQGHSLISFHPLRSVLALYFFVYAYVVARGMIPLPDEPPRINFWGLFCVTGGMVLAYQSLTTRYRVFLFMALPFLILATWQLGKRIRFLEMMLESNSVERMTQISLGVVFLTLLTPKAFLTFDRGLHSGSKNSKPPTKPGFPF